MVDVPTGKLGKVTNSYYVIDKSLLQLYFQGNISLEVYRYYSRLFNLVEIARIQGKKKIDLRQIGFSLTEFR